MTLAFLILEALRSADMCSGWHNRAVQGASICAVLGASICAWGVGNEWL